MKLGLISDIHGDLASLQAALGLLQHQGAKRILCMGDLVDKGPDGDAVVTLIRDLNIPCVRGNHDEDAYGNQFWMRNNADLTNPIVQERLLSTETIDYLKNLPFLLRYEWGEAETKAVRILVVHGTPFNNSEYLLTTSRATFYQEIANMSEADVILFGHTHTPMSAYFDNVWFFNPGAVLCLPPNDGFVQHHSCATLTLPEMTFTVFNITTGEKLDVVHLE